MTLTFEKALRQDGVDGQFDKNHLRVTVKPEEFPAPLYPDDAGFWKEFSAVIDAVCAAHDDGKIARGVANGLQGLVRTAGQAAELVHSDWPTQIITLAIRNMPGLKFRELAPLQADFTDGVVLLNHLMSWGAHAVSPNSFCAKWHFMVPRPEEVAGAIMRGELDAPASIVMRLNDLGMTDDQASFTVYPEGCPRHPSYNAMHSAAAGAALAVAKVLLELNGAQANGLDLAARNMAFFRTSAGVHYPQDNYAGLWLGQETMRRLLPKKMETEFGVDSAKVEQIIEDTSVKWIY